MNDPSSPVAGQEANRTDKACTHRNGLQPAGNVATRTACVRRQEFHPVTGFVTQVTGPWQRPAYVECEAVPPDYDDTELNTGLETMSGSAFIHEAELPLEIRGYEINTALDVFVLTRQLDAHLALALEEHGYARRSNIVLSDGQSVDGWVKI